MAGSANLVDVNQDGKFDENDYVRLQSRPSLNEYFYNLLSEKFKQSLQNAVKDIYWVELTQQEVKKLFVEKQLEKDWKLIKLDYDLIFTKWWDCFNSTIWLINLTLWNKKLWIDFVTGTVFVNNVMWADVDEYMGWYAKRIWDKSYEKSKQKPEPEHSHPEHPHPQPEQQHSQSQPQHSHSQPQPTSPSSDVWSWVVVNNSVSTDGTAFNF